MQYIYNHYIICFNFLCLFGYVYEGTYNDARTNLPRVEYNALSSAHADSADSCTRRKRRNACDNDIDRDTRYCEKPVHYKKTLVSTALLVPEALRFSKCQKSAGLHYLWVHIHFVAWILYKETFSSCRMLDCGEAL